MKATLAALALAAASTAPPPATLGVAERAGLGLAAIRPQALSARTRFLSSDLLEGRGTGTRGHELAELYVATEMQALGLEPAGEAGTFFQTVPMRAWRVDQESASLVLHPPGQQAVQLIRGQDFVALSDGEHSEVETDAPVVFAGYAISAPEYGYDDLRGAELQGKIAVVLNGAPLSDRPNFFPPAAHAVYADRSEKVRRLAERGAAGVLFVYTPDWEDAMPWEEFVRQAREEGMDSLEGGRIGTAVSGVPARAVVSLRGLEKLLAAAGLEGGVRAILEKADAGRLSPQPWRLRALLRSSAETREVRSSNVAGLLRGSDRSASGEVVVLSAHLDHLGIGEPADGGVIYNGAMDNAAGVAVLLEVARAFSSLPTAPRRSVLFVAVTGEEKGLVGSRFFANHPTVPKEKIVADLNIDGTPTVFPFLDAVARGAGDSTLAVSANAAAAALGIEIAPDPDPRANVLIRSDQYSFIREGIPSLFVTPGLKGADPNARRQWIRERYHTPRDKWDAAWDWEGVARFARLQFLTAFLVAEDENRPRWNQGDFFERFARKPVAPQHR